MTGKNAMSGLLGRVQGFEAHAWDLGFSACGLRVWGSGFEALGSRAALGFWGSGFEGLGLLWFRVRGFRAFGVQGSRVRAFCVQGSRV